MATLNDLPHEDDEIMSIASTTTENSSKSSRSINCRYRRKKLPASYKFDKNYAENHGFVIYSVSFNDYIAHGQLPIFATVGSNRCSVYECPEKSGLRLLMCYADPDAEEAFYTCAWTFRTQKRTPLLVAAGQRAVIRVLDVMQHKCICSMIGHGGAINQLKIHPIHAYLLLSCSKDYGVRLWNLETGVLIAIFSGVDGHRAEVLSIDFELSGERIISSGMDHALKIWNLNTHEIKTRIEESCHYVGEQSWSFPTIKQHYPSFSTRDIHGNYVDCVQWFGDFIISKSCQNAIIIWTINSPETKPAPKKKGSTDTLTDILVQFKCTYCELWFVRFDFNIRRKVLAVGNQYGTIFVWELSPDGPEHTHAYKLSIKQCKCNIRDVAFSKYAEILIAVSDDGTIWRWNRVST